MKENKLVELSMDFAVKIIKLYETIKGHHSLINQLERSVTSISANIYQYDTTCWILIASSNTVKENMK